MKDAVTGLTELQEISVRVKAVMVRLNEIDWIVSAVSFTSAGPKRASPDRFPRPGPGDGDNRRFDYKPHYNCFEPNKYEIIISCNSVSPEKT